MTWGVILSIIGVSLLKALITCMPTSVVNWFVQRFATHTPVSKEHTQVKVQEKPVEEKIHTEIIHAFNSSTFLEPYYIHEGNRSSLLSPKYEGYPIHFVNTERKHPLYITLYCYRDRIDVIKRYKRKVKAYSILSDRLQKEGVSNHSFD